MTFAGLALIVGAIALGALVVYLIVPDDEPTDAEPQASDGPRERMRQKQSAPPAG